MSLAKVMERRADRPEWKHLIIAPLDAHRRLLAKIQREAKHASEKRPARIAAKLNSLVDPVIIQALYEAAAAGVKIDLVVRAMCSLVPRDNIRVVSIIDRFLEHSRIIRFENGGDPEIYLSSGDWMQRNFNRRVEVMFPLLDPVVREQTEQILEVSLQDGASSWQLNADGSWQRRRGGMSSQQRFIDISRAHSFRLGPTRKGARARGVRKRKG